MARKRCQLYARTLCLLLLIELLGGCALWGDKRPPGGATTQQPSLTPAQLNAGPLQKTPLQGWRPVLRGAVLTGEPGLSGAGGSSESGLIASAVHPGRVAGCALPSASAGGFLVPAVPVFILSDDAGLTWDARVVTKSRRTNNCTVVADTQQPDTFVINVTDQPKIGNVAPTAFVTMDAGRTWRELAYGSSSTDVYVIGLTNGVALAYVSASALPTTAPQGLAEATLTSNGAGSWHMVYTNIPGLNSSTASFEAVAMDPNDPSHLYVAMSTGAFGVAVYATTDAGASWHSVLRVSTAITVLLWTANNHQVFMEVYRGQDAPYQLYYSANGATTWNGIATHYRDGGESIYCSPAGRLVSVTVQSATGNGTDVENFFTLDPTTGTYTLIGTYPFSSGVKLGVVVDGPTPTFMYGGYLRSLPPQ